MLLTFTPTFKTSSSAAPPGGFRPISDNVHNFIENGPIGYDNSFIDNSRHALIISCPVQGRCSAYWLCPSAHTARLRRPTSSPFRDRTRRGPK